MLVTWVPVDLRARDRRGRNALDLARPGSAVAAVLTSCGLGPHLDEPTVHEQNAARADAVEVALLDHISRSPAVQRTALGDGFVFRTGLEDNSRNGVVCSRLSSDVEVADVVCDFVGTLLAGTSVTTPTLATCATDSSRSDARPSAPRCT